MPKKSQELLDMALRELHTAIKEGKEEIEILLKENTDGSQETAVNVSKKYETKKLTEIIRAEFADYEVKSVIYGELNKLAIVSFKNSPCRKTALYSIKWKLSLQKK